MAVTRKEKKKTYFQTLAKMCEQNPQVLLVHADHVGSRQMAEIRFSLREKAVIMMGKNTTMRTCLRGLLAKHPDLEKLVDLIKLNIGFVFCLRPAAEVRDIIMENRVPAPARQGVWAPDDVYVPAGPTSLDPSQTSFFQALGINTKIVKGQIEIQNDIHLIKIGERVTASQAVLLQKLDIRPFSYGLGVSHVYDDGSVYDAEALNLSDEDILKKFKAALPTVAAFSRGSGIPTKVSVPHNIVEAFKLCCALVIESDFSFPQLEAVKNAAASAPAAAAPAAAGAAPAAAKAPEPEEEEEESEGEMGFSLFD